MRDQLPPRLGESQIPTNKHANLAKWRVENRMLFHRRRSKMVPFYRAPQVLLDIPPSDGARVVDEVSDVEQHLSGRAGIVQLQDRAWDNVDVEFFGEVAVVF